MQYTAFEDDCLKIVFNLKREEQSVHAIKAQFTNKTPGVVSQINL